MFSSFSTFRVRLTDGLVCLLEVLADLLRDLVILRRLRVWQ